MVTLGPQFMTFRTRALPIRTSCTENLTGAVPTQKQHTARNLKRTLSPPPCPVPRWRNSQVTYHPKWRCTCWTCPPRWSTHMVHLPFHPKWRCTHMTWCPIPNIHAGSAYRAYGFASSPNLSTGSLSACHLGSPKP